MTKDEIQKSLGNYIAETLLNDPNKVIGPNDALISGGLIDSFSLMDIALFVETTWDVRLENTELNQDTFDSLSALAEIVKNRMAE